MDSQKKKVWKVVAILIITLASIYFFTRPSEQNSAGNGEKGGLDNNQIVTPTPIMPKQGLLTLTTEWTAPVLVGRGERIESYLLTPNVWWRVRINGNKVYDLTPANAPGSGFMDLAEPIGAMEWSIHPTRNPAGTTGQLTYKIEPKA